MLERIKNILRNYANVQDLTEDTTLVGDLGLSSFDVVSVVADFEDEFDIEIPDRDIRRFVTVGDVEKYLKEKN